MHKPVPSAPLQGAPIAFHVEGDVDAELSYASGEDGRPVIHADAVPAGQPWELASFAAVRMRIADARQAAVAPRLDEAGFELVHQPTAARDFGNEEEIRALYYPEVRELALATARGRSAYVFDHVVRRRDENEAALAFGKKLQGQAASAIGRIHNDYTELSGHSRLRMVLGEGSAADAVRHYCIVNVWRPVARPALDAPLTLCDARTVSPTDAVAAELRYPQRSGEVYLFRHADRHRWSYFPAMTPDEAVVFKQFDTRREGVSRFTPHTAFIHPGTPPGTPPRQSIEARVLVVLE